ncbi:translation initiation factor IF-2-like [Myotis myotis]|uniref:translation initiation factor IF-2-like n=1 Tax=Myotis myotis TaxID=51298 RepID=UPI00174AA35B|nr:translation initiation factor IF-2-like [Myotis myotis]
MGWRLRLPGAFLGGRGERAHSSDAGRAAFASWSRILVLMTPLGVRRGPRALSPGVPWVPAPDPRSPPGVSGSARPGRTRLLRSPLRAAPSGLRPPPLPSPHPAAAAPGSAAQKQQRQRRQLRARRCPAGGAGGRHSDPPPWVRAELQAERRGHREAARGSPPHTGRPAPRCPGSLRAHSCLPAPERIARKRRPDPAPLENQGPAAADSAASAGT